MVAGQVFVALGIFANLFALGRLLTPAEYGVVALGLALSGVFQQSLWGPLSNAMSRFYSASTESGSTRALLGEGFHLARVLSLSSVVIAGLCVGISSVLNATWGKIVLVAVVLSMGYGFTTTLDALQNAARNRTVYAGHQVLGQVLRLIFATSLILLVARTGMAALIGYALGSAATSLTATFLLRRIRRDAPLRNPVETDSWRSTLRKYAFPFATWGLLSGLQAASDRWSLRAFCTGEDVGLYSAAYQLGYYPVVLVGMAVSQFVMPILFQKAGDGTDVARLKACFEAVRTLTRLALFAGLGVVAASVLMHKTVFTLFFGPNYAAAASLWPISIASGTLFIAGQYAAAVVYSFGKSHLLILPFGGTAIVGILLNLGGAALGGIEGVNWAVFVTSLFYFGGPTIVARRIMKSVQAGPDLKSCSESPCAPAGSLPVVDCNPSF